MGRRSKAAHSAAARVAGSEGAGDPACLLKATGPSSVLTVGKQEGGEGAPSSPSGAEGLPPSPAEAPPPFPCGEPPFLLLLLLLLFRGFSASAPPLEISPAAPAARNDSPVKPVELQTFTVDSPIGVPKAPSAPDTDTAVPDVPLPALPVHLWTVLLNAAATSRYARKCEATALFILMLAPRMAHYARTSLWLVCPPFPSPLPLVYDPLPPRRDALMQGRRKGRLPPPPLP